MHRALALAAILAAAAPGLAAVNAAATVLPGDRLHGNILAAGDEDRISIDLVEGTLLSVDLLAEKGSDALPVLAVQDPDQAPVDVAPYSKPGPHDVGVRVRKAPVPATGTYTLVVTASPGGKYLLRAWARPGDLSKRDLYLSPSGFGEAPKVLSVLPSKALNDRTASGVVIAGTGFDLAATVRLEKAGKDPIDPSAAAIDSYVQATADFPLAGASPGAWRVIVENPSGGAGRGRLTVQSAGSVRLPAGVRKGTEVWWLEFDETEFQTDLNLLGFGSSSSAVANAAEAAVKSYAVFFARRAFGLTGLEGKLDEDDVPVSFVLNEPAPTVGLPGTAYNRLRIGGAAGNGDPSCNPYYAWGECPLDTGNASFDDVSAAGGTGRGVKTRVFDPAGGNATASFQAAFAPLLASPLTSADGAYFDPSFFPSDAAQGARYRDITRAVETLGKELGGTIAHFVARAMGQADGGTGLSAVPANVGEYAALANFGLTAPERAALAAAFRDPALPGSSATLRASYLPLRETQVFLLPEVTTARSNNVSFRVAGGRPDKDGADLEFTGVAGGIPLGTTLNVDGTVSGTPPLFFPGSNRQIYGGVFRFKAKCKDVKSGEAIAFFHRINLIADENHAGLDPGEKIAAQTLNSQTRSAP